MTPRSTPVGRPTPVGRLIVFAIAMALLVAVPFAVAESNPPPDADARRFDELVVPPAATPRSQLPAAPRDWRPGLTWEHVVYWAPGEDDLDLYSMDVGGLIGWRLTAGPANEAQPALNPTGTRLAYISDADGDYDLYVADYQWDGPLGAPVNLSNNNVDDYWPSWSPDGTRIAYYSEIGNQADIFVAGVNGGPPIRLTADPAFDGFPSWSPDGARIAFSSWRGGGYRIHVMNADGTNVIRLSQQPGSVYPAWSRDGSRIAYSADYTVDGWLEGMIMNADGSGQTLIIDKPGPSEPQMRAWSLDGEMVYTTVNYIQYQGRWYIQSAYLAAWSLAEGYEHRLKMDTGYGFDPSWERVDTLAPESSVAPLPATSPAPIAVHWSGRDNGPSRIAGYDVQFRRDGGEWTDWLIGTTDTTATYPGRGGATYAFRARATDWAGNVEPWSVTPDGVTTVEALAPQSNLEALPRFHPAGQSLTVRWSGRDFGGSGVRGYSVRFALGEPPWTSWLVDVPYLSETFSPRHSGVAPGDTLTFQMRAVDQAYNEEPWPAAGEQTTTFYGWGINGRVTDHTGVPIGGATAVSDPPALASLPSDTDGNYATYTVEAGAPATLTWSKDGYGPLPPVSFPTLADAAHDLVLPPADNVVANGDFAAGATDWQLGGSYPPQLSGGAALLGRTPAWSAPAALHMTDISVHEEPRVFADGSGTAVAVWIGRYVYGHTPQTYWARRGPDGAWNTSALLVPYGRSFDGARDAAGRLHLLVAANEVYYLRQEGTGWAAPQLVAAIGRGDDARLRLSPDGTLHALWVARQEPGLGFEAALYYAQLPPGGQWSAPETVYQDTLDVRDFDLVPLPDGSSHLVRIMQRPGEARYYLLSQRRVAGQWLKETELAVGGYSASFAVSAAPGGRVYLLYSVAVGQQERSGTFFRVAHGDTWCAPERLAPAVGDVLALNVTPAGEVRALTLAGELSFLQRPPGGGWSAWLLAATFSADATMTTTPDGVTHVVWRPFPGGSITYTRVLTNGVRQSPVVLSPPDAIGSPAVDAGPDGAAHVVWLDGSPAVETVYSGPAVFPAIAAGQSMLTQEVTSPLSAYPVLSFVYETGGPDGAQLQLLIDGAAQSLPARLLPATPNGPRHYVLDLPGTGTRVLTFRLTMPAGRAAAWATIDDVSLGGARPDVWVRGHSAPGLPGETVVHTLEIGNRGRAPAADVVLSYVLPASLTYTEAEPPPDGLSPLRWDIGALAPDQTVVVRLETEVGSGPLFGSVTSNSTVEAAPGVELELLNNTADVVTWLARGVYLPLVLR